MDAPDTAQVGVSAENAFGLDGHRWFGETNFPLSFYVEHVAGRWLYGGAAARLVDLFPVLIPNFQETVAVLNVDQVAWLDDTDQPLRPRQIADSVGVEAEAWDISGLRPNRHLHDDLLAITPKDLPGLLGGWGHFGIDLIDLGSRPDEETAQRLVLDVNAASTGEVLSSCPGSSTFFSSHDDLYFRGETRIPELPTLLFGRLLALFVAAGAATRGRCGDPIRVPGRDLTMQLVERSREWAGIVRADRNSDEISIGLIPEKWRLGERVDDSFHIAVTYSFRLRQWTVTDV